MQDDTPIEAFFDVPYTAMPDDWGLSAEFEKTQIDGSSHWDSPIKDYAKDLEKVNLREPQIDPETTNACLSETQRVLGDILSVRMKGTWWWSLGVTMPFVFLRGLEKLMFDFYDYPDETKELLSRISSGHLRKLDWLEQEELLSLNNDATYVGSGGYGLTDSLPSADYSGTVRCKDMWGFTESQETVGVSSQLYEEFIFPYEKPIMDRFGLTCYGCCEPVNNRWDVIKRHHNLRRVSCSPWADFEKMAEYLKKDYIFSMKVNPADVARNNHERQSHNSKSPGKSNSVVSNCQRGNWQTMTDFVQRKISVYRYPGCLCLRRRCDRLEKNDRNLQEITWWHRH
jgi:hypothetical protein